MTAAERRERGFYRYPDRGWIAGVCFGVAHWLGVGVRWVRVIAVLTLVFSGVFPLILIYAALWYAMDRRDGPVEHARSPDSERTYRTPPASDPATIDATFARLERRLRDLEAGVTEPDFTLKQQFRELEQRSRS